MLFKLSSDIALQSPEQEQAVEFYQKILGLEFAGRENDSIALKSGDLHVWFDKGERLGPILEFLIPDLEEARKMLLAAGYQIFPGRAKASPAICVIPLVSSSTFGRNREHFSHRIGSFPHGQQPWRS